LAAISGSWFARRAAGRKAADAAYAGLLSAARDPVYFSEGGVPDTFEGRAGWVTVLTAVACARLSGIAGPEAARLVERLNARVLDGFDAAYRETGVGDHSIARKVRTLAEHHAGLGKAVFVAVQSANLSETSAILARNGLAGAMAPELASAVLSVALRFANQPDDEVMAGAFDWP
jgi:cytochrome b pre-mRNA-processing protein 3